MLSPAQERHIAAEIRRYLTQVENGEFLDHDPLRLGYSIEAYGGRITQKIPGRYRAGNAPDMGMANDPAYSMPDARWAPRNREENNNLQPNVATGPPAYDFVRRFSSVAVRDGSVGGTGGNTVAPQEGGRGVIQQSIVTRLTRQTVIVGGRNMYPWR